VPKINLLGRMVLKVDNSEKNQMSILKYHLISNDSVKFERNILFIESAIKNKKRISFQLIMPNNSKHS